MLGTSFVSGTSFFMCYWMVSFGYFISRVSVGWSVLLGTSFLCVSLMVNNGYLVSHILVGGSCLRILFLVGQLDERKV